MMGACFIGIVLALVSTQSLGHARLPNTYAVCSREHNAIYTVDLGVPNVQCVVVSKDLVADRGSIDEIRRRWGDKDAAGHSWRRYGPWEGLFRSGVKMYYLEPGEAMFPGFTDAHAHILGWSSFLFKNWGQYANLDGRCVYIGYGQSKQLPLYGSPSVKSAHHPYHKMLLLKHLLVIQMSSTGLYHMFSITLIS